MARFWDMEQTLRSGFLPSCEPLQAPLAEPLTPITVVKNKRVDPFVWDDLIKHLVN